MLAEIITFHVSDISDLGPVESVILAAAIVLLVVGVFFAWYMDRRDTRRPPKE